MAFLRLLASIRTPFLDAVMQFFTYFGEELLFMVLALVVFWCVDKKKGYYILSVGFFGTIVNQFLKLWFRIPRPWVRDPGFSIVESARAGATGYSFPSGHTQNVVGTFGCVARFTKRRWLRVVCILLPLLVAFSRMYLGVHTPLDVGVSFVIAVALVLGLYPLMERTDKNPKIMPTLLGIMLAVNVAYVLFVKLYPFPADLDAANYTEGIKNGYTLLGALLGLLTVYFIDTKKVHFQEAAPFLGQLLKVVLGLAGILIIKQGLKPVFAALFPDMLFPNAIRYFCIVLFAGGVWPLTFPFFTRLGKKKEAA